MFVAYSLFSPILPYIHSFLSNFLNHSIVLSFFHLEHTSATNQHLTALFRILFILGWQLSDCGFCHYHLMPKTEQFHLLRIFHFFFFIYFFDLHFEGEAARRHIFSKNLQLVIFCHTIAIRQSLCVRLNEGSGA